MKKKYDKLQERVEFLEKVINHQAERITEICQFLRKYEFRPKQ